MEKKQMEALFTLAGIQIISSFELANLYWPRAKKYLEIRSNSPWWLVKTGSGLITIGWRKRVICIDWSDTGISKIVTDDDVTKDSSMVHAYSLGKAAEYLKRLGA
jgi:hypothetical protein